MAPFNSPGAMRSTFANLIANAGFVLSFISIFKIFDFFDFLILN